MLLNQLKITRYLFCLILLVPVWTYGAGQVDNDDANRNGYLVRIGLPITPKIATGVEETLKRLAGDSKDAVLRNEDRPVVVLEFDCATGKTGQGSDFESCLSLARLLTSEEMNRLVTVAFVPGPRTKLFRDEDKKTKLVGHAVLVAIAANELAVATSATIGSSGIDGDFRDPIVKASYEAISGQFTLPKPIVLAMLDKNIELHRAKTDSGWDIVDREQLEKMVVSESATLVENDKFLEISGQQLLKYGLTKNRTESKRDLATRFRLRSGALDVNPSSGIDWKAVVIELPEYIDRATSDWMTRALQQTISNDSANLFIFEFNSSNGDPIVCMELAQRIAEFDEKHRTVAFINDIASGPAAVAALACNQMIMNESARLGGAYDPAVPEDQLQDVQTMVGEIARALESDEALMKATFETTICVSMDWV